MTVDDVPGTDIRLRCESAIEILRRVLRDCPLPASQVRAAAAALGLSWRTVQRASLLLGVQRRKDGMQAGWIWTLPAAADDAQGANRPGAFGRPEACPPTVRAPACLAAFGYEVPDDGLMHGVPQQD